MKKIFSFLLLGLLLSVGNAWAAFEKATSIAVGDQVVLVVEKSTTLMELSSISTASTKYGIGTAYTETPAGTMLFDVVEGKTEGTFAFKNGNNYLYWGSGNSLATNATLSANSSWTVSFNGTTATITNAQQATRVIWWNANSPRFACYENKSDGNAYYSVQLYKKITTGVPDPTFSPAAGTYSSAQSVTLACENDAATIYYTTDGTEPTNSSTPYTGAIAISATTTIKAVAYVGESASTVAHAEYRIVTVEHAGTVQDPYTVADARNAIDLGTGLTGVYATGIVSEIVTVYDEGFGNITFDIIDEGGSDVLRAYRCGGEEAANVLLGDTVVVSGNLVNYNSVYEFSQGCQIVSLKHPVAPAVPSIDVEETSINATAEEAEGTITVTYNNITNVAAEVYFCNAAGTEAATYEWLDADINNQTNNVDYVVEANTGDARTAYMKVWAYDDELNAVYSEIITISQDAYVAPFVITDGVFDFTQDEDYGSGVTKSGVKEQTSTWIAVNVTMYMAGRNCWYNSESGEVRLYKASSTAAAGSITLSVPEGNIITNIEFTGASFNKMGAEEGTYVVSGDKKSASWNGFANSVLFTATDRTDIYTIEVTYAATASLTLGANGYSTFAADFKYTVSNAEVYEAALNGAGDAIILTKVENAVVPANAGIILKGTEGATVTITPSNDAASTFSNNQLVGVLAPTEAEANWYVLATDLDGDGLTKFHNCQAGIEIPANKAYMVIGEATAPSIRIIEAGNEATDIQNVEGAEKAVKFMENGKLYIQKNGVVYDAMGKTVR